MKKNNYLNKNNISWYYFKVTRQDREILHKHRGMVLWFTGLSGSGKSTIANIVEQELYYKSINTYLLDGDNVRHGLSNDLSFTNNDRREHIRRVGEVTKLMFDAGLVVLSVCISPYRDEREKIRNKFPIGCFIEVFIDTALSVCECRDVKGLYKKFRSGKIKYFTGIDDIYEKPLYPEVYIDGRESIEHSTDKVLKQLWQKMFI